jgi:hypothetical protein
MVCPVHILEPKCRPSVRLLTCDLDVPKFYVPHMSDKEAVRGQGAKHPWLRIAVRLFFWLQTGHIHGSAT